MADFADIIKKAVEERDKLQEQLNKMNIFIEMAQRLAENPESQPRNMSYILADARPKMASNQRKLRIPSDYIIRATKKILNRNGRPMTRFELVKELEGMNIEINGVDKAKNLGTILWRSSEFISTDEGYWLANNPSSHELKKA